MSKIKNDFENNTGYIYIVLYMYVIIVALFIISFVHMQQILLFKLQIKFIKQQKYMGLTSIPFLSELPKP